MTFHKKNYSDISSSFCFIHIIVTEGGQSKKFDQVGRLVSPSGTIHGLRTHFKWDVRTDTLLDGLHCFILS